MSCWSLESPLSFMPAAGGRAQAEIAGVAEPHAHRLRGPRGRGLTPRNQHGARGRGRGPGRAGPGAGSEGDPPPSRCEPGGGRLRPGGRTCQRPGRPPGPRRGSASAPWAPVLPAFFLPARATRIGCPSVRPTLSVSRAAVGSLMFPWSLRAPWLRLMSLARCLHEVSSDRTGEEDARAAHRRTCRGTPVSLGLSQKSPVN